MMFVLPEARHLRMPKNGCGFSFESFFFLCLTHFNFHTRCAFCAQTMVELNHNGSANVKLSSWLVGSSAAASKSHRKRIAKAVTVYWNHVPTVNLEDDFSLEFRRCLLLARRKFTFTTWTDVQGNSTVRALSERKLMMKYILKRIREAMAINYPITSLHILISPI